MGGRNIVLAGVLALLAGAGASEAQVVRQVTHFTETWASDAAIDDAGSAGFAISNADPFGTNPGFVPQLFRWDLLTGAGAQLTFFTDESIEDPYRYGPSVTDDGQVVAFVVDRRVALIRADGTGLTQLTTTPAAIFRTHIAGNGSRVVFDSTDDLTGQNPNHWVQVFAVEADGSGLRQLTNHVAQHIEAWPSISDDGARIAYRHSEDTTPGWPQSVTAQVAGVLQDGSGWHAMTSFANLATGWVQISGNGASVAFRPRGDLPIDPGDMCQGDAKVAIVNWDGTDLHTVAAPCTGATIPGPASPPDITDNATTLYFAGLYGLAWDVFRRDRDRSNWVNLTLVLWDSIPACDGFVRVAGNGGRAVFTCTGPTPWGPPSLDESRDLHVVTSAGAEMQLTQNTAGDSREPAVSADGGVLVFTSTADLTNEGGAGKPRLFRSASDGSGIVRLAPSLDGIFQPTITAAGDRVVFFGNADTFNGDTYIVGTDGSGLTQLTPHVANKGDFDSQIAANGSVVVLNSNKDLLGEGGITGRPVFRMLPDGTGKVRLTAKNQSVFIGTLRVDPTGTWVAYVISGALHRQRTDGTLDQVVPTGGFVRDDLDIASGGAEIVYQRASDLWLWKAATGTSQQLTTHVTYESHARPVFSRDGTWMYYWKYRSVFGADWTNPAEPYRIHLATGAIERLGGLAACSQEYGNQGRIASTSSQVFFESSGDCVGENRDLSAEILRVDLFVPPRIAVSPGSEPTIVTWDVEPSPTSYDVIRGNVASLAPGPNGTTDLGTVVCLENDSTDATTRGHADTAIPGPGEAFFYLYRGSPGSGAYGNASGGAGRAPSSLGCPD